MAQLPPKEYWLVPATVNSSVLAPSQGRMYTTIEDLAKIVVCFGLAQQPALVKRDQILTHAQAVQSLYTFLQSSMETRDQLHLSSKYCDWNTTELIYQSLNLVRMNEIVGTPTTKVQILIELASQLEAYWSSQHQMDTPMLIQQAREELKNWTEDRCLFSPVVLTRELKKRLSGLELDFVDQLLRLTHGREDQLSASNTLADWNRNPEQVHFFAGYGIANEIKYVVNTIYHQSVKYGDVAIYYYGEDYEPFLISELEGRNIPVTFVTGRSIQSHDLVQLAFDLIDWNQQNLSLDPFYVALHNPILKQGKDLLRFLSNSEFQLGDGKKRYQDYENRYQSELQKAGAEDLFSTLLSIGAANTAKEFLTQFLVLAQDDSLTRKSETRNSDRKFLQDIQKDFSTGKETDSEFSLLRQRMESASIAEPADPSKIQVERLTDFTIPTRPYCFFLGLSQNELQAGKKPHSIFREQDFRCLSNHGFLPTRQNLHQARIQGLMETLGAASQPSETQFYFGYSQYDTVKFLNQNPSEWYRDLFRKFRPSQNFDQIPVLDYGHQEQGPVPFSLTPLRTTWTFRTPESPSSLEVFTACPKKYYFRYQIHSKPLELPEPQPDQWLNAGERGQLIHEFLKTYMDMVFRKVPDQERTGNLNDPTVNSQQFDRCFQQILKKYRTNIPPRADWLVDQAVQDWKPKLFSYVQTIPQELSTGSPNGYSWQYLVGEYAFETVPILFTIPQGAETITLCGAIDRIDYALDPANQLVHIRIWDYKSGKRKNFSENCKAGIKLQQGLYAAVVQDPSVQKDLLNRISKTNSRDLSDYSIQFESFTYTFPLDSGSDPIRYTRNEIEDHSWDQRFLLTLSICRELNSFPKAEELPRYANAYESIKTRSQSSTIHFDQARNELTARQSSPCQYCEYQNCCGKERTVWNH